METELLNKILTQVEKVGTDLTDFREEVYKRFDKNEKELAEFRQEMYKFKNEIYEFKEEMYKFTDEVDERFDKSTKEIADEIHELSKYMSSKVSQAVSEVKKEIRIVIELNGKNQDKIYA